MNIQKQIKKALDGRTQRWLALEIKMPESNFSKKMAGKDGYIFTVDDLKKINRKLGCNISKAS